MEVYKQKVWHYEKTKKLAWISCKVIVVLNVALCFILNNMSSIKRQRKESPLLILKQDANNLVFESKYAWNPFAYCRFNLLVLMIGTEHCLYLCIQVFPQFRLVPKSYRARSKFGLILPSH